MLRHCRVVRPRYLFLFQKIQVCCYQSIAEWNMHFESLLFRQSQILLRSPRHHGILIPRVMLSTAWAKRVSGCIPSDLPADWVIINFTVAAFVLQIYIILIFWTLTNWRLWRTLLLFGWHRDFTWIDTAWLTSAQFWRRIGSPARATAAAATVLVFGHSREAPLSSRLKRFWKPQFG